MTVKTYNDAYKIARQCKDRVIACKVLSSLLWHVEDGEGGFIGLSDEKLEEKCSDDPRLSYAAASAAMYAPMPWPEDDVIPFPVDPLTQEQIASIPRGIL